MLLFYEYTGETEGRRQISRAVLEQVRFEPSRLVQELARNSAKNTRGIVLLLRQATSGLMDSVKQVYEWDRMLT